MILVVGAVSMVLGIAATLMASLFRVEKVGRDATTDTLNITRLGRQFRQDVRAAKAATVNGDPGKSDLLELEGDDDSRILYTFSAGRLTRERLKGKTVEAHDLYAAERIGPVRFSVDGSRVAALLKRRPAEGRGLPRPEIVIEATLAKDRRLAETVGGAR